MSVINTNLKALVAQESMRSSDLKLSAATMNDNDRSSIQLEVAQLKSQIDDIATKTNHNNIKLLDGSAQKVVIQTGTNQGDTINLNFASARTKDIGVGTRATLASAGGQYVAATSFDALEDSAMYLNGVAIGASQALSDNGSTVAASASAISKAAAINAKSDLSGVYAKVDTNVVSGTGGMTATALTGTITINGVTTDSFSTSAASTSLSRKATVTAINAKSEQTGVVAIDTEDDTLGVTLQAADGRNIDIAFTTLTAAATGVRDTGTFVGSYNLYTLDSRSIDVSFQTGDQNVEAFSGLRNGTYASDTALYNTYKRATAAEATAPSDTTTGTLSNDSLIINGVAIGQALATDDTASDTTSASSTREASAIAIAAAINRKTDLTGVTASASPNVIRGEGFTAGTSADVYLNGVTFTANAVTRNAVIDSFNDVSDRTGVVASAWGEGIELRAVDGRNISIGSATAANIGLTGIGIGSAAGSATAVTYYSQVTMQSDNKFTVKSGNAGIPNLELLGFRQGTFGGADNGLKINQVDVSTVSGANQAIVAIDAAIETISKSQANSGALNNRMDYIVANLSEASQNMSASRSRILDTDYASETTSLAKQQIISQAATAMLAQANQQPQSVLSLLK